MTENEHQPSSKAFFASLTVRIIHLAILTAVLVIGGFVLLENRELHKVIPLTPLVNVAVLLGQALTVVSTNYFLANRAKNFTDSISEVCIMFAAVLTSVSILGPYMFLKKVGVQHGPWYWPSDADVFGPNDMFHYGLIPAGLCFLIVVVRIFIFRSHAR